MPKQNTDGSWRSRATPIPHKIIELIYFTVFQQNEIYQL